MSHKIGARVIVEPAHEGTGDGSDFFLGTVHCVHDDAITVRDGADGLTDWYPSEVHGIGASADTEG